LKDFESPQVIVFYLIRTISLFFSILFWALYVLKTFEGIAPKTQITLSASHGLLHVIVID